MNSPNPDSQEILRRRARALARTPVPAVESETIIEVLEFRLARERYAVEKRYVQEVSPFKNLTPLPCTPPFVRGVVNVRGRILPVLDIKVFFGLPEKGLADLHSILLVRSGDVELGLLADEITGMRDLPVQSLESSLSTMSGIRSDYLKGVTADRLIVLDLARILADPKLIVHEEVEG